MERIYNIMPIISGICFGSAGIFVRELSENMNSTSIISSRILIAILLLGLWIAVRYPMNFRIKLKDSWIFVGAGVLGTLGLNLCYNFSINELSLSLAAVLIALAPIFVMVFAFFMFHEAITAKKVISIILALVGCVLTSGILENNASMHWSWIGILVGSASAGFYALYSIFSKVGMKKSYPALTITFYSMLAIVVVLLPFTQWDNMEHYIAANPLRNTLFMVMHSLCTAVCPYAFYTVALDHMEAGKASILCSCEPVAAMVFGLFFFEEIPTVLSVTGLMIVLLALAMLVLSDKSQGIIDG
ncbi:DMT family transporter [Phascolarctobacterium sp.]|uniref:DMT family transporter n=1 Tax=Phascolarctobacterium sp. TaxID=2049039 RepID=UPI0025F40CB5|nr:DMT family transporter [Phascolarctobacterium sp.]